MDEEKQKTAKALQTALQMEVDGKEFYLTSEEKSTNDLARKLFHHLAEQEDVHYRTINEIYGKIEGQQGWPDVETTFKHGKSLQNVFKEAVEALGENVTVTGVQVQEDADLGNADTVQVRVTVQREGEPEIVLTWDDGPMTLGRMNGLLDGKGRIAFIGLMMKSNIDIQSVKSNFSKKH